MRIHYFQHMPFEGLARIEDWARERGHALTGTRFYENDPLPDLSAHDALVVMGGPMNIYEEDAYPWLAPEKRAIRAAVEAGKIVLGVCLGSQLLAAALGARVYPGPQKEIGWFPITLTEEGAASPLLAGLPRTFPVFHWHGDTFDLPAGAVRLAESAVCRNQAFAYGERVLGLQCHLEMTPETVQGLIAHCGDELVPGPTIQPAETLLAPTAEFDRTNGILFGILDRLLAP